jgi:hypothetical protein
MTVQCVSQVTRVSSPGTPMLMQTVYRAVSLIQLEASPREGGAKYKRTSTPRKMNCDESSSPRFLQGIILPPSCTGSYPFETEVRACMRAVVRMESGLDLFPPSLRT